MWPILFLLIGVQVNFNNANSYCDNNIQKNYNCSCLSTLEQIEFHCPITSTTQPDIVVTYNLLAQDLVVQGNSENFKNYENITLPQLNASSATYLHIKFCPYINISRVVDKFQMKNVKTFKYESSRDDDYKYGINIDAIDLKPLKDIEYLGITDSPNLILDKDFLKYTSKLRQLNVNRNNLITMDYYFSNSSYLIESINFSDNQITSIPDNIFKNVTQQRRLELWHNNITGLTEYAFYGLKNLRLLELSYNHVQEISKDTFSTLTSLEVLSLKSNNLGKLNEDTFKNNQKLQKLRLDRNSNLELPDYLLSNLTNLKDVNLDSSNIENLPEHLFEGSFNLVTITASNNNLETLPVNLFKDLINLGKLNLSKNKLKVLPTFSTLKNLNELILNDNNLKVIETETFQGLTRLKNLNLNTNRIAEIKNHAFLALRDLENLDLSFNKWTMPDGVWRPLNDCLNVKEIKLDHNRIDRFPDELFTNLVELQYVNLSFNPIDVVSIQTFAKVMGKELIVDLSNTKIDVLDFGPAGISWWSEFLAKTNLLENNNYVEFPTTLFLNSTNIPCNCLNYGLLLYNAGLLPNIKQLVKIDQRSLNCMNSSEKPSDLEPGHCSYPVESCPQDCSCNYRPFNKSFNVDCSNRNLTNYPKLDTKLSGYFRFNQTTVDLSGNALTSAPDDSSYKNVTHMNLVNNSINHISYLPPHIQIIHLDNNRLSHLNKSFLDKLINDTELRMITLNGNPWACDCESRHLQHFLQKYHQRVDGYNVRCIKDNALLSQASNLCPQSVLLAVILPVCLGVLLVFSIAFALYYRYQRNIKIYLFHKGWLLWLVTEEDLDKDKKYDVFISYDNNDADFAEKILLSELENGDPQYKGCIHVRDWEPGEYITNHVLNSVKNSRRTLIVLTNNFLKSSWGKYEFKMAHTEAVNEGMARIIMIIKGDIDETKLDDDMKSYIKNHTYIKWEDKYFWQKLKYALPHSAKKNFERNKERNKRHQNMMLKIDDKFQLVSSPSPAHTSTPPLMLNPELLKVKEIDGEEPLFVGKNA